MTDPRRRPEEALLLRVGEQVLRFCARSASRVPEALIARGVQMALDASLCAIALLAAYELRFDGAVPATHRQVMWALLLLLPVVRPLLMLALGAYDAIWRFFNIRDAAVFAVSASPVSIALLTARYFLAARSGGTVVPASVVVIEFGLYLALGAAIRIFRRVTWEASRPAEMRRYRALLVGREATLSQAVRQAADSSEIELVGLLAPEAKLQGLRIGGVPVMERPAALGRLLVSHRIDLVLIADAGREWIAETVATASEFGTDVRLLPSAASVVRGEVRVWGKATPESAIARANLDEGAVTPSHPHARVVENFSDRVVLITGAGGSIGSELARQVATLPIASLVLLDRDENSIFELSNELAAGARQDERPARVTALVGDIRDAMHVRSIFEQYRPHIVLHAAAYKHVPLMESNACEAVMNNVTGSRLAARAAVNFGAERFVMISTDKAVRPSSIMGATKRIAEMLVSAEGQKQKNGDIAPTRVASVRFGNVVGSRGSVVPIFLRQIAAGGPLTITDEHMTRYFMTIPEAAQLVLQAASLASQGDIYMLDMGNPVKITALAHKLIELSGLRPEKDIKIQFVGARPGEKVAEQLWHTEADVQATEFPRVFAVKAEATPAALNAAIEALEMAAQARNEAAVVEGLRRMPIGFVQLQTKAAAAGMQSPSTFVN